MLAQLRRSIKTLRKKRGAPLHVEFNLTDFCNLNCKGCSHYSPLAPAQFEPMARLGKTMKTVSSVKNAEKIEGIYLIGGETLLYPGISEAIRMGRRYFPWAVISVFTNGLLLPKMKEDFWEACRETGSIVAITRYPVKFDYDKVEALCLEKGVRVEIFGDRSQNNSFFKLPLDPEKKQNGFISHFRCFSFGCITIDGDKVFPCSQAACVGHLNRRFGTEFKWEKGDYIPVEELRDVRQLFRLRNRPVPFCRYCRPVEATIYGPSRRAAEEWL